MAFSSLSFLFVFLPAVLLAYGLVPTSWRNALLLAASLLFYAWGGGVFVILLLISTIVDFTAGRCVVRGHRLESRAWVRSGVALSVVVNLGLLAYFKYAGFIAAQIDRLTSPFLWSGGPMGESAWASIVLPIGISFYTFQSMSYTIDLAQRRAQPVERLRDFALYVTLFPQLVAGPIVRYHELSEQLNNHPQSLSLFVYGVVRFSHGLVKKIVVADAAGVVADAAFALPAEELTAASAWLGAAAYTVQIYFDFSGYSDMAIGLAALFGFRLPENFRRPYSALSITDFWRRWHMSLSRFFRDYLYIPFGGSRRGALRTAYHLWIVFLLVGLWHGAAWTMVLWGAYHGLLLSIERLTNQRASGSDRVSWKPIRRLVVALLVLFGWVLFRAQDLDQARYFYAAMVGFDAANGSFTTPLREALTHRNVLFLVLGLAAHLLPGRFVAGPWLLGSARGQRVARLALLLIALPYALVSAASGSFSPFLYFQF